MRRHKPTWKKSKEKRGRRECGENRPSSLVHQRPSAQYRPRCSLPRAPAVPHGCRTATETLPTSSIPSASCLLCCSEPWETKLTCGPCGPASASTVGPSKLPPKKINMLFFHIFLGLKPEPRKENKVRGSASKLRLAGAVFLKLRQTIDLLVRHKSAARNVDQTVEAETQDHMDHT